MPRGLKTHIREKQLPKVEKGIAPMVKPVKSKAMPIGPEHVAKMIPTIKKQPKSLKIKF